MADVPAEARTARGHIERLEDSLALLGEAFVTQTDPALHHTLGPVNVAAERRAFRDAVAMLRRLLLLYAQWTDSGTAVAVDSVDKVLKQFKKQHAQSATRKSVGLLMLSLREQLSRQAKATSGLAASSFARDSADRLLMLASQLALESTVETSGARTTVTLASACFTLDFIWGPCAAGDLAADAGTGESVSVSGATGIGAVAVSLMALGADDTLIAHAEVDAELLSLVRHERWDSLAAALAWVKSRYVLTLGSPDGARALSVLDAAEATLLALAAAHRAAAGADWRVLLSDGRLGLARRTLEGVVLRYFAPALALWTHDSPDGLPDECPTLTFGLERCMRTHALCADRLDVDAILARVQGHGSAALAAALNAASESDGATRYELPYRFVAHLSSPLLADVGLALALAERFSGDTDRDVPTVPVATGIDSSEPHERSLVSRLLGSEREELAGRARDARAATVHQICVLDGWQSVRVYDLGTRCVEIARVPFTRLGDLVELEGLLRQQHVCNTLVRSCARHHLARVGGVSHKRVARAIEVQVSPPARFTALVLTARGPLSVVVHVDTSGGMTAELGPGSTAPLRDVRVLTDLLGDSMSLPLALHFWLEGE